MTESEAHDLRYDEDGCIRLSISEDYGSYSVNEWVLEGTDSSEPEMEQNDVTDYGAPEYLDDKFYDWAMGMDVWMFPHHETEYEVEALCREFRAYLDPKYDLEAGGGSWECPETCPRRKVHHQEFWHDLKHREFLEIKPHISGYCWKDGEQVDGMDFGIPDWLDEQLTEWSDFHDAEFQELYPGNGKEPDLIKLASLARAYVQRKYGMLITAPGIDGIWVWPPYRYDGTYLIQFRVNEMTPNAEKIWQGRSEADRKRILNDVWCPWCKMGTRIENYSGGVNQNGDLVLGGLCPIGHPLERIVKAPVQ